MAEPFFEVGEIVRIVEGTFDPETGRGTHMIPLGRDVEIVGIVPGTAFDAGAEDFFYSVVPDKYFGKNEDLDEDFTQVVHESEIRSVMDFEDEDDFDAG